LSVLPEGELMQTSIAALLAVIFLAGCAGAQASPSGAASAPATPSATASPQPLFVQLTDEGCATTPASLRDMSPGTVTWRLQNQSTSLASYQLLHIEEGSFDELDAFFRGSPVPSPSPETDGLPFVIKELERVIVESGDEGLLTDEVGPGLYAIACIVLDEHEDIVTVHLIGPFTAEEGA
jgi:hypothetical protein